MDGYTSKKDSINEIADNEKPDVITLNDTNLKGKMKVKVPNYFSFNKKTYSQYSFITLII